MPRANPFDHIPPDKTSDYLFLLQKVYDGLCTELEVNFGVIKSKIGEHNGRLDKLEGTVGGLTACPCGRRHDPTIQCPLYVLENEVFRTKWQNKGMYAGAFMAGALVYYSAQLLFQYLRVAG